MKTSPGRGALPFGILLGLLVSAPTAQASWTIPGIANAGGLNGTRFVSDLTISNPGATTVQAVLSFLPASAPNPQSITLSPGQTIVYKNVAETLFGVSGAGALAVSSADPLLVHARTYNTAASGTFGVALPVYADDRLLTPGETGDSLWISQDASGGSGYRTNVAVVFPDEGGGEAIATVYDADGNELGHKDFALDSAGFQQFSVGSFAGTASVGRAHLAVTRGRAAGYAVVVDNVTGDSSLFTFEDLPGGIQDVLVNGVARANGRNGTFFRTDGRFYNPTDTDATVTVAFHASGNANTNPVTASFTLPAGKIRDVVDVLDTLLSLPVGSSGALRFRSDWPVAILCKTSNVDPAGATPGTFGAQQKPVPLLSFLTSADAGAIVSGIRQNAAFRTNVGFAAGADGASYTLTLKTASGATVTSISSSLGVFGWTQPGVQELFPGVTIPDDASLHVKVTSGSVDVYDSSIDNASGDSVLTPSAPLPESIPSSATIGPAGGSIRSTDGKLTLRVPSGSTQSAHGPFFQTTTNDAPHGIGDAYQILPADISWATPPFLKWTYGTEDVEGSSPEALTLATSDGGGWAGVGGGSLDTSRRTLTVRIASPSPSLPGRGRAARAPLAPPSGRYDWARTLSWRFSPIGTFALPTRGNMAFSLKAVGRSSSTSLVERIFLSVSPQDVSATWSVNGQPGGNIIDGTIINFAPGAFYTAGVCPPPRNPVTIQAHISNGGPFSLPYRPFGYARVRIVPRKWTLSLKIDSSIICRLGVVVSDQLGWDAAAPFELDDNLQIVAGEPSFVSRHGTTPRYCLASEICPADAVTRSGIPKLVLNQSSLSGKWDGVADAFDMTIRMGGGSGDWVYNEKCSFSAVPLPIPSTFAIFVSWMIRGRSLRVFSAYSRRKSSAQAPRPRSPAS